MPPVSSACVPGGKGGTDSETPTGFFRTALLLRLNPVRGIERGGVGDHTAAHRGDKKRLIGFRVASALRGEEGSFTRGDGQCHLDRAKVYAAKSRCRHSRVPV